MIKILKKLRPIRRQTFWKFTTRNDVASRPPQTSQESSIFIFLPAGSPLRSISTNRVVLFQRNCKMNAVVSRRCIYLFLGLIALFLLAFFQSSTIESVQRDFRGFNYLENKSNITTLPVNKSSDDSTQPGTLWHLNSCGPVTKLAVQSTIDSILCFWSITRLTDEKG